MKFYKLMTELAEYPKGLVFSLTAKHRLMSGLTFMEQRQVLWVEVDKKDIDLSKVITDKSVMCPFGQLNSTSH